MQWVSNDDILVMPSMTDFKIEQGITQDQIDQLLKFTHSDPVILKFTSDATRFKDKASALKWLKHTKVYTLTDSADDLIGIFWFDPEPIPDREFTIKLNPGDFNLTYGIRIYGKYRGSGLAYDLMNYAFNDFKPAGIWGQLSSDNIPSIKLAEKFGFKKVSEPDSRGKIIMLLEPKNPL